MTELQRLLCWLGGSPVAMVANFDSCLRRKHTARGLVFAANFVLLAFVWCAIGWTYIGAAGLLCPGLLVPTILVLGYGRLIAMQTPRLTGDLAIHNMDVAPEARTSLYWTPRVLIALMLSTMTTVLLIMSLNQQVIHQQSAKASRTANAPLLQQYEDRINSDYDLRIAQQTTNREELAGRLDTARAALSEALTDRARAETALDTANHERNAEAAGWDRPEGPGPKYRGWLAEIDDKTKAAKLHSDRADATQKAVDKVDADIATTDKSLADLKREQQSLLAAAATAITHDIQYVPEIRGLFYDATLFLRLYRDPDLGAGLLLFTLLTAPVLFAFELSDIIAVTMSRCKVVAVGESLRARVEIAKLVSQAESEIARANSGGPTLRIVPTPGADRYPPDTNGAPRAEGRS